MTSPSLDSLNHPVIIIDTNLTIEYANQSWETLWRNFHNHSLVKSLKFYLNDQSVNSIRAEIDD